MLRRLHLAWRLYFRLNYSWRLAWHKAAYRQTLYGGQPHSKSSAAANDNLSSFIEDDLDFHEKIIRKTGITAE